MLDGRWRPGPSRRGSRRVVEPQQCPGDSFDGLSRACLQGPGRETHGKKGCTLGRCRVGQWAWGCLTPSCRATLGTLARRHRDGFCTVRRVHGPHHSPPPVDCELCQSPHYQPSKRCQARKAAREGERWMLGTCPLVVIHGGDVTSESVVLVVRTTRSGCPCFVGGIITTTTSAGGRPFVSRALPCPALPCPAQAGSRATDGSISPCSASTHSPGCPRGSQIMRALPSVVDWPRARRPVVSCLAGLRAMPRPAGSRKASAPQRGAEPW